MTRLQTRRLDGRQSPITHKPTCGQEDPPRFVTLSASPGGARTRSPIIWGLEFDSHPLIPIQKFRWLVRRSLRLHCRSPRLTGPTFMQVPIMVCRPEQGISIKGARDHAVGTYELILQTCRARAQNIAKDQLFSQLGGGNGRWAPRTKKHHRFDPHDRVSWVLVGDATSDVKQVHTHTA